MLRLLPDAECAVCWALDDGRGLHFEPAFIVETTKRPHPLGGATRPPKCNDDHVFHAAPFPRCIGDHWPDAPESRPTADGILDIPELVADGPLGITLWRAGDHAGPGV